VTCIAVVVSITELLPPTCLLTLSHLPQPRPWALESHQALARVTITNLKFLFAFRSACFIVIAGNSTWQTPRFGLIASNFEAVMSRY
jgi:hypothetical protein